MATVTKRIIHHLPLTKARINFGSVVKRVHLNKEYVILEKDGIPIAGIMDIDELEDYLDLQDPGLKLQIKEGYQEYLAGKTRPLDDLLAELQKKAKKRKKAARARS